MTIRCDCGAAVVASNVNVGRSVRVARSDIAGFSVSGTHSTRGRAQFHVQVVGADQRARRVLGALTEDEAFYLAQELKQALAAS